MGKVGGEPDSYGMAVGIKNSNLKAVPDDDGCKLLDVYLINKMYEAENNRYR